MVAYFKEIERKKPAIMMGMRGGWNDECTDGNSNVEMGHLSMTGIFHFWSPLSIS